MKRQTTTSKAINNAIRAAAGYWSAADAQPAAASSLQPPKLPSANAGNGANQTGVGVPTGTMNDFIRAGRRGGGGRTSWTTYGDKGR